MGATSYKTRNHALGFALRGDAHLLELKLGLQDIPNQNYPNQRMDMTRNDSHQINLRYQDPYDWGQLQARACHEKTRHAMTFGEDKQFWYGPTDDVPGMPMDTRPPAYRRQPGLHSPGTLAQCRRDGEVLKPTGTAGAGRPASTPQIIVLIAVSACP